MLKKLEVLEDKYKELTEKIIEFYYDNYMKKLQDTFENIGLLEDGNATERVLDIIKTIK